MLSNRAHAVAILTVSGRLRWLTYEVVFESMQRDRDTLARSPPGTSAGGSLQIPSYTNQLNLAVLTHLEPSRAPVHELDSPLRPDVCYGRVHVFRDNITSVKQATGPDGE